MTINLAVNINLKRDRLFNIDVKGCDEDVKKKVQQAFFDIGMFWQGGSTKVKHLEATYYTNAWCFDDCPLAGLRYGELSPSSNAMKPDKFFELVYTDNTIYYKDCVIYTYNYSVYFNHEFIGKYKTLAAAKAAATRKRKIVRRIP